MQSSLAIDRMTDALPDQSFFASVRVHMPSCSHFLQLLSSHHQLYLHGYCYYKMARLQFALLLTFCVTGGDAFVTRPFVTTKTQQSKLMAMDPIHLFDSASTLLADGASDYIPGTSGDVSYSRASYYTILALYLSSFPGLWSTIKRSTSAKIKRKTYVTPGEKATGGKGLRDQAGEIMACT